MKRVYLAGPISGLTHDAARYGWRQSFTTLLEKELDAAGFNVSYIECFSPMRGKDELKTLGIISSDPASYGSDPISSEGGIVCRDSNDVRKADALIACFLESGGRPSLGTAWELGIAHDRHVPVIMIAPPGDPNREHVILHRSVGYVVETLEQGARLLRHLLTPGI
jgi:nucleoside 2-deoxyribosyltransferase